MSPRRVNACRLAALAVLASPFAMVIPTMAQQPSPEQIETIRQACRSDFMSHCSGVQPGGREALQCLERNAAQLSPACGSAVGAVTAVAPNPEPARPAVAAPQPQPSQASEQDQLGAVRKACTLDDFMSHCSWIQPGNPELLLCLRANAAQLSAGCQTALGASPAAAPPAPVAAQPPAAAAAPPPAAVAVPPPAPAPAAPRPTAAAKQPSAKQISAIRAACRSDFMSHCSGVQPGSRDALQCLERNKTEVSQRCQGALAALGESAPGAAANPAASPAPTESLPVRRLRPREEFGILRACAADARDLCGGTPPGGGRIIGCLARNAAQLNPQCRAALAEARN